MCSNVCHVICDICPHLLIWWLKLHRRNFSNSNFKFKYLNVLIIKASTNDTYQHVMVFSWVLWIGLINFRMAGISPQFSKYLLSYSWSYATRHHLNISIFEKFSTSPQAKAIVVAVVCSHNDNANKWCCRLKLNLSSIKLNFSLLLYIIQNNNKIIIIKYIITKLRTRDP